MPSFLGDNTGETKGNIAIHNSGYSVYMLQHSTAKHIEYGGCSQCKIRHLMTFQFWKESYQGFVNVYDISLLQYFSKI